MTNALKGFGNISRSITCFWTFFKLAVEGSNKSWKFFSFVLKAVWSAKEGFKPLRKLKIKNDQTAKFKILNFLHKYCSFTRLKIKMVFFHFPNVWIKIFKFIFFWTVSFHFLKSGDVKLNWNFVFKNPLRFYNLIISNKKIYLVLRNFFFQRFPLLI